MKDTQNLLASAQRLQTFSRKLRNFSNRENDPLCNQIQTCARQINKTVDHKIDELFRGIVNNFDRTILSTQNSAAVLQGVASSKQLTVKKIPSLAHSPTVPNLLGKHLLQGNNNHHNSSTGLKKKRQLVYSRSRQMNQTAMSQLLNIENSIEVRKQQMHNPDEKKIIPEYKHEKSRNVSLLTPQEFQVLEPMLREEAGYTKKSLQSNQSESPRIDKVHPATIQEQDHQENTLDPNSNSSLHSNDDMMQAYQNWIFEFRDYRVADETEQFLKFQRQQYKNWDAIQKKIKQLCVFAVRFDISDSRVNGKKLLRLLELREPHKHADFLNCFENSEEIIAQTKFLCLRYLGKKGKEKAATKLQAFFKMKLAMLKYKKIKGFLSKVKLIQRAWRIHLQHKATRTAIKQNFKAVLDRYQKRQAQFKRKWDKLQYQERVQVHINSFSVEEIKRLTTEKFLQKQNSQISRVFRLKDPNLSIIYVCPFPLSAQVVAYFRKVLDISQSQDPQSRLHFVWPDRQSHVQHACLCNSLLMSPKTLSRINGLLKNKQAYLVPGYPSNGYIKIADKLNIPIYGCHPNKSVYLSTKIGSLKVCPPEHQLHTQTDIYTQSELYRLLSLTIYQHPSVDRWFFKIDDEKDARGIAYLDVKNIKEVRALRKNRTGNQAQDKELIMDLFNVLQTKLKHKLKIVYSDLFKNYDQYMTAYLSRGGILQASPNCLEGALSNVSFFVDIPPAGEPTLVTTFQKVSWHHKPIATEFPCSKPIVPEDLVSQIIRNLQKQGIYGYTNIDFLVQPQKQQFWFMGVDCYMTNLSSSYYQARAITNFDPQQQTHLKFMYCPLIIHSGLTELRMKTFFHLCRLANVSFDIKRNVGSIFTFVDSLQSGTIALMSICDNRYGLYKYLANALEFFGSKLAQQAGEATDDPRTDCIKFSEITNKVRIMLKKLGKPLTKNQETLEGLD